MMIVIVSVSPNSASKAVSGRCFFVEEFLIMYNCLYWHFISLKKMLFKRKLVVLRCSQIIRVVRYIWEYSNVAYSNDWWRENNSSTSHERLIFCCNPINNSCLIIIDYFLELSFYSIFHIFENLQCFRAKLLFKTFDENRIIAELSIYVRNLKVEPQEN